MAVELGGRLGDAGHGDVCGTLLEPRNSKSGRGDWIRTSDPLRPRQVRYQAALRPATTRHYRISWRVALARSATPV